MPLASPRDQPSRSRVEFSEQQIRALVGYVASLGHGPPIPSPRPAGGSLATGFQLFTDNCAGCHQVAAQGGYVKGARVPPLNAATDVQIAEAVRAGPYLMPRFTRQRLSDRELDSIIRYVDYAKAPQDPGGWSIGRIGPVPEGMVAWLIAAAALVAACLVLGRRLPR
jgi:ubiquinol-cytochrome c reductase cytochrome c subunit